MPVRTIILGLLFIAQSIYGSDADSKVFGVSPGVFYRNGTDLIIGFNLRIAGEPAGLSYIRFPEKSRWRAIFEQAISAGDLNSSYYSIRTKEELPKTGLRAMPTVDFVTDQVLQDMKENSIYRNKAGLDPILTAPDDLILSIQPISQNEFLHVQPRIIPDPTTTK